VPAKGKKGTIKGGDTPGGRSIKGGEVLSKSKSRIKRGKRGEKNPPCGGKKQGEKLVFLGHNEQVAETEE